MNKSDLKSGMIIKLRDGYQGLLVEFRGDLVAVGEFKGRKEICGIDTIQQDLSHVNCRDFDIVEVRYPRFCNEMLMDSWNSAPVIWKKNEVELMINGEQVDLSEESKSKIIEATK